MKQILRYFVLFTLVLVSIKASADDRVVIASLTNGTITVDNANPTGAATVTLTVTPAEGYYITAEDIKYRKPRRRQIAVLCVLQDLLSLTIFL
jgi:hypothetical protein